MRRSSFEMMRIVAFMMLVSLHVSGQYFISRKAFGTVNWHVTNILDGGCRIAAVCFMLLTGYFLGTRKDPKPWRYIWKILSPLPFYLLLYYPLFYKDARRLAFAARDLLVDLLSNQVYLYHLWYLHVLVVVYLLAPYLNLLIESLPKKGLRALVAVCLTVSSVIPTLIDATGATFYRADVLNSRLVLFVALYLLGAYIRKHVPITVSPAKAFWAFAAINSLIVVLTIWYNSPGSPLIFFARLRGNIITHPFNGVSGAFYDVGNLVVISSAVALLVFFSTLDFQSEIVNRLSRWSYGAYLCHVFWIQVLARVKDPCLTFDLPQYPLAVTTFILAVGAFSFATEGVRQTATKWIRTLVPFWRNLNSSGGG